MAAAVTTANTIALFGASCRVKTAALKNGNGGGATIVPRRYTYVGADSADGVFRKADTSQLSNTAGYPRWIAAGM